MQRGRVHRRSRSDTGASSSPASPAVGPFALVLSQRTVSADHVSEPIGERRARVYRLDAQASVPPPGRTAPLWGAGSPSEEPIGTPPRPAPEPHSRRDPSRTTQAVDEVRPGPPLHGPAIVEHLQAGPRTRSELADLTGLTLRQVGYALRRLRDAGLVATDGGRGVKGTQYRLASSPTSDSR